MQPNAAQLDWLSAKSAVGGGLALDAVRGLLQAEVAAAAGEQAVQAVVRLLISRLEQEDQDRKEGEVDDDFGLLPVNSGLS